MGNQTSNPHAGSGELLNEDINMIKTTTKYDEEEIRKKYETFKNMAPSGTVEKNEFLNYFKDKGVTKPKSFQFLERLFDVMDKNRNGSMDFREFILLEYIMDKYDPDKIFDVWFTLIDKSNDGYASYKELVNFGKMLGEIQGIDEADVEAEKAALTMFAVCDLDKTQKISKEQFIKGMKTDETTSWYTTVAAIDDIMLN